MTIETETEDTGRPQKLEEARESSPLGLGKEHDPADTLILNFWLLETEEDTFLVWFCFVCSVLFLRQGFTMQPCLVWNLLGQPGWS